MYPSHFAVKTSLHLLARRVLISRWISLFAILISAQTTLFAASQKPVDDVLVLYDSAGQFGWVGEMNARFLLNLLGHFPQTCKMTPVEQYVSGDALRYRATFYFGNNYNNALPNSFLQDVMATTKPICWFKYNLWKLGTNSSFGAQFQTKFGFRFDYMDPSGYPQIEYKGEAFSKNQLEAEIGRTTIINSNRARAMAVARQLPSSNSMPYVVKGTNFWYVGDIPFSYISEEDRYLIFADLLHDMIQRDHAQSHKAIIRLEDVDPTYDTATLRAAADYLKSETVPFAVAVIPRYKDPHGFYDNGTPSDVSMSQAPEFVRALKYMVASGGQLVMHGYTHQYGSIANPYTAVSGDDYEFFRVTIDAQTNIVTYSPVPEDAVLWVQARLSAGLQEFNSSGLNAVAFEAPHYAASALDYRVFATNFPLTIHRVLYTDMAGHIAGQFFPYTIERDAHGQKVLPENLGNVDPYGWNAYPARFPADMLRAARKNRVLRDGWASGFFHPYLDLSYLRELIAGLKALGFTFVQLDDTVRPTITAGPENRGVTNGTRVVMNAQAAGTPPLKYQWKFNGANITGATNTSYTITSAQSINTGIYTIVVTNAFGSATNPPARLQVTTPFSITNFVYNASGCNFNIRTQNGIVYTVEFKDDLNDEEWKVLSTVTGNGTSMLINDTSPRVAQRFYRVTVK